MAWTPEAERRRGTSPVGGRELTTAWRGGFSGRSSGGLNRANKRARSLRGGIRCPLDPLAADPGPR